MASLQKFKLLATQCAVSGSPTRSPTASPVYHLRRRKTLRMLLSRSSTAIGRRLTRHDEELQEDEEIGGNSSTERKKKKSNKELGLSRHKLKDLFVSSPPLEETANGKVSEMREDEDDEVLLPATGSVRSRGSPWRRGGVGSLRPLSAAFRNRLLRRAWRPVLVTIPE